MRRFRVAIVGAGVVLLAGVVQAQSSHEPVVPPGPHHPPPLVERPLEPRQDDEEIQDTFLPDSDGEWGLPDEMIAQLADRARVYRQYARSFICVETVRNAEYGSAGEASKEKNRQFEYLLDWSGRELNELRAKFKRDGEVASGEANDDAPFPPAYSWAFLFSEFNQNYFEYRELGNPYFEGFDYVRVFQFKGALPWSDGKDIREWEGVAVVDGTTLAPLEIRAEPTGQSERLRALYDVWSRSFNIMGMRTGAKPLGHRCLVRFGLREAELNLPTALRYDTFRVTGVRETRPTHASIRQYERYRFIGVTDSETFDSSSSDSP